MARSDHLCSHGSIIFAAISMYATVLAAKINAARAWEGGAGVRGLCALVGLRCEARFLRMVAVHAPPSAAPAKFRHHGHSRSYAHSRSVAPSLLPLPIAALRILFLQREEQEEKERHAGATCGRIRDAHRHRHRHRHRCCYRCNPTAHPTDAPPAEPSVRPSRQLADSQ